MVDSPDVTVLEVDGGGVAHGGAAVVGSDELRTRPERGRKLLEAERSVKIFGHHHLNVAEKKPSRFVRHGLLVFPEPSQKPTPNHVADGEVAFQQRIDDVIDATDEEIQQRPPILRPHVSCSEREVRPISK